VKFTIDFELSRALEQNDVLTRLLSKSVRTWASKPLEALLSEQFSLTAAPDYPLAAIAADADGLDVVQGYWMPSTSISVLKVLHLSRAIPAAGICNLLMIRKSKLICRMWQSVGMFMALCLRGRMLRSGGLF
jgi:hypothetical protein